MKRLYTLATPSHQSLHDDWFRPTLQDDYIVEMRSLEQVGASEDHCCGTVAFNQTMVAKVRLMLDAIRENWGGVFIYSDVDIQFFGRTEPLIDEAMSNLDVAAQRDAHPRMSPIGNPQFSGHLCAGFLACRGNERTLRLWEGILAYSLGHPDQHDQQALNHLLSWRSGWRMPNRFGVRWGYLPDAFFGPGPQLQTVWEPGMPLATPATIVMHHANWTIGIANKVAQLVAVRRAIARDVHDGAMPVRRKKAA
jgi:hypothetical protein